MRWLLIFLNSLSILKNFINAQFIGNQFPLNQQEANLVQNQGISTLQNIPEIQAIRELGFQEIPSFQGFAN